MRTRSFYTLLSAALLAAAALPAQANGPFTRPSTATPATASTGGPEPWVGQEEREAQLQKRKDEAAKTAALAEKRVKYNLKEGQDVVEMPFNGARVGTVNGMNVFRGEGGAYYFEAVEQRKYVKVATQETYQAQPPQASQGVIAPPPGAAGTPQKAVTQQKAGAAPVLPPAKPTPAKTNTAQKPAATKSPTSVGRAATSK